MSNEKFKVKFGLAVGDTSATIDGTTGNIVTNGSVKLNGSSSGSTTLTQPATGSVLSYSLPASGGSPSTVLTNDGAGNLTWALPGGPGSTFGNISIAIATDNTITTTTGDLILDSSTNNVSLTSTVYVESDLTVNNGTIKTNSGNVSLFDTIATTIDAFGAATAIDFGATGSLTTFNGDIKIIGNDIRASDNNIVETFDIIGGQNPNLVTSGNIVKGNIRDATTKAAGNIFSFSSGGGGPTRGLSIDNSVSTGQRSGIVLRAYGGGLAGGAPIASYISETARGSAASPTGLASGNGLGAFLLGGYADTSVSGTGAGWVTDTTGNVAASLAFQTTEAWTGGTGAGSPLGTRVRISTNPTGSANALQTSLEINPQLTISRSDTFTWANGKTNALTVATLVGNDGSNKPAFTIIKSDSTSANEYSLVNFNTFRSSGGTYTPTQNLDIIGQFKFGGNALSGSSPGGTTGPGASISTQATETWTTTAQGATVAFSANKTGTTTAYTVINATPDVLNLNATTINLNTYTGSTPLIGNNIVYNRVYGQWQYNTTVTPAGSNTAYAYPIALGTTDYANIASIASTSRIIPGAAGIYKTQFSVQVQNNDAANDHIAYFWWRKNGTDVTGSMGRVGISKATGAGNTLTIAGWDNMISSANTTDYWELMYAVDDATHVTFPTFAATAFGPSTASMFVTLTPVGA